MSHRLLTFFHPGAIALFHLLTPLHESDLYKLIIILPSLSHFCSLFQMLYFSYPNQNQLCPRSIPESNYWSLRYTIVIHAPVNKSQSNIDTQKYMYFYGLNTILDLMSTLKPYFSLDVSGSQRDGKIVAISSPQMHRKTAGRFILRPVLFRGKISRHELVASLRPY